MVDWVVEAARPLGPEPLVVVASPDTAEAFDGASVAVQERPLGTGDAVRSARQAVGGADEVLVLSGDTPLLTTELPDGARRRTPGLGAAATVLSFVPDDIRSYGRIVRDEKGDLVAIVEAADATPEELAIRERRTRRSTSSARTRSGPRSTGSRPRTRRASCTSPTPCAASSRPAGASGVHVAPDPAETEGVNTRVELAAAAAGAPRPDQPGAHARGRDDRRSGVDVDRPDGDVRAGLGRPPVHGPAGRRASPTGAEIGPHVVAIDATIGPGALVGPFCYLRPGTVLEVSAKAGTFVELKNTVVGEGAKVPHLSYMGDAEIGDRTNIGAGSITANFPHEHGRPKGRRPIGRDVRVAVDTVFVAPVTLGDDAWTAAGTVVTDDVPENALVGVPASAGRQGRTRWTQGRLSRRCPASSTRPRSRR